MQKFFDTFFSILMSALKDFGAFPASASDAVDKLMNKFSDLLWVAALGATGIFFVLTGFLVSFFQTLFFYDQKGLWIMSAVTWGGTCLVILGAGLLFGATKRKSSLEKSVEAPVKAESPKLFEKIAADLIVEFGKEMLAKKQENSQKGQIEKMELQFKELHEKLEGLKTAKETTSSPVAPSNTVIPH